MKIRMLAGAACAALMGLSAPVVAATGSELPAAASYDLATNQAVDSFYASRGGAPLWLRNGVGGDAAREFLNVLQRASLDGMPGGPAIAAQAQVLLARA